MGVALPAHGRRDRPRPRSTDTASPDGRIRPQEERRLITIAGTLLATAAIAAGSANAYPAQDLRSPDSRDAASTSIPAATTSATAQDLRSPDARDSAERPAAPVVVRVERTADSSLSWEMIGLGALISTGLLITIAGAYVLIGRRRTHGPHVA